MTNPHQPELPALSDRLADESGRCRSLASRANSSIVKERDGRLADLLLEAAEAIAALSRPQDRADRQDAYKFRRLAQLLSGFDFRLGRNALMPPATYLDSVEITCEFQPGIGQSVIDAIFDVLVDATPTAGQGGDDQGVTQPDGSGFRQGGTVLVAPPEASPKPQVANPADADTTYPTPAPAASVSERARAASLKEIVPAEKRNYLDDNGNPRSIEDEAYAHGWNACRAATLRALEQALTQQRGASSQSGMSYWAVQFPGKMPKLYGAYAFAEVNWYPDEGGALVRLQEVERIGEPTTPQPRAEGLRDAVTSLVAKWRRQAAEHGVRTFTGNDHALFANELESLLAGGGGK